MQPSGVWVAAFLGLIGLLQFGPWFIRCCSSLCSAPVFRFELRDFGCRRFLAVNPLATIPVTVGCCATPRGRPDSQQDRGGPLGRRWPGSV